MTRGQTAASFFMEAVAFFKSFSKNVIVITLNSAGEIIVRKLSAIILTLYLLNIHCSYGQNPAQEFTSGKRTKFSTAKHPKANGINLSIEYPKSWLAKEGERPHIVQKFISDGGLGNEYVLIIIKPLPIKPGTSLPESQLKEIFSLDQLNNMIPQGATIISVKKAEIEGLPAGILEYSISHNRLGMIVNMQVLTYVFIWKSNIIKIQCSVGNVSDQNYNATKRMEVLKPLYKLIANSIVLHDKWASDSTINQISPTPSIEHSNRHYETAGGFSYCPPIGWTLMKWPSSKYMVAQVVVSEIDIANIVFVDEIYRWSLSSYVDSNLGNLKEYVPKIRILSQSPFHTNSGINGTKAVAELPENGINIRLICYFFDLNRGRKLAVTCRCVASKYHYYSNIFDNSMRSLMKNI